MGDIECPICGFMIIGEDEVIEWAKTQLDKKTDTQVRPNLGKKNKDKKKVRKVWNKKCLERGPHI
jgi:hypothetical protein